ncbi:MAG: hypothetical protein ACRC1K_08435, partial [Planctomycetia bacterium]
WYDAVGRTDRSDFFQTLLRQTTPPALRRRWGEHYTPDWTADAVVKSVYEPGRTWVDPSVGTGVFALALARRGDATFTGFDRNPWTLLAALANAARAWSWSDRGTDFVAPLECRDFLADDSSDGPRFDRVLGNPPWQSWDVAAALGMRPALDQWRRYGLLVESGMASVLGGSKKELAGLFVAAAADRLLATDGLLSMVLPLSLVRSSVGGRGLRGWRLPDGASLALKRVDDLSALAVFPGAAVQAALLVVQRDCETTYPVPYYRWTTAGVEPPAETAAPSDASDDRSSLAIHGGDRLERVVGPCDYTPRLGVNPGGAAGVFWMERLAVQPDGRWLMRNLSDRGKRTIESVEAALEPDHLFPALLGKDVRGWRAVPSAWVLIVQDPVRRRGIDMETLRRTAPATFAYLERFEAVLSQRAILRRFFSRPTKNAVGAPTPAPFYSQFNVGDYSFAPAKATWNRLGGKMAAAAVDALDGRPIQPQDTHGLFAVETRSEADYLCALLNSMEVRRALAAFAPVGTKSFATPGVVGRLRLRRYDPADDRHRRLAALGGRAAVETAATGAPSSETTADLNEASADYWFGGEGT